jgi:chromosome partitioning protein
VKRIALLSLKGGVGKTLSSIAIAQILASKRRAKIALMDLDPEGSARAWAHAGGLPFAVVSPWEALPSDLDAVILDTPPNDRKLLVGVAESADAILLPLRAGEQEIDRLRPTLEALAGAKLKAGATLGLIVTDAGRDNLSASMPGVLEAENLPVFGMVYHSVRYQRAFGRPLEEELLEPYRVIVKEAGL